MTEFPEEAVLVARGKYATLASERRNLLKFLRDDIELAVGGCTRGLRSTDDVDFAFEQLGMAKRCVEHALAHLANIAAIVHQMNQLKPLAWGERKEIE